MQSSVGESEDFELNPISYREPVKGSEYGGNVGPFV